MEQIAFRAWQIAASVVDTDILKLDIEAKDGSDILEVGDGPAADHGGEQYTRRFTTQKIEDAHRRATRRSVEAEAGEGDEDESGPGWLADEDETLYLRGWEVTALVDEEGLLNVYIEKGEGADIYEVESIESGAPLGPRVLIRLAAEDTGDDEEEEDEDEGYESDDDDYDELDEFDDLGDEYDDEFREEEDDLEDVYDEEDVY